MGTKVRWEENERETSWGGGRRGDSGGEMGR